MESKRKNALLPLNRVVENPVDKTPIIMYGQEMDRNTIPPIMGLPSSTKIKPPERLVSGSPVKVGDDSESSMSMNRGRLSPNTNFPLKRRGDNKSKVPVVVRTETKPETKVEVQPKPETKNELVKPEPVKKLSEPVKKIIPVKEESESESTKEDIEEESEQNEPEEVKPSKEQESASKSNSPKAQESESGKFEGSPILTKSILSQNTLRKSGNLSANSTPVPSPKSSTKKVLSEEEILSKLIESESETDSASSSKSDLPQNLAQMPMVPPGKDKTSGLNSKTPASTQVRENSESSSKSGSQKDVQGVPKNSAFLKENQENKKSPHDNTTGSGTESSEESEPVLKTSASTNKLSSVNTIPVVPPVPSVASVPSVPSSLGQSAKIPTEQKPILRLSPTFLTKTSAIGIKTSAKPEVKVSATPANNPILSAMYKKDPEPVIDITKTTELMKSTPEPSPTKSETTARETTKTDTVKMDSVKDDTKKDDRKGDDRKGDESKKKKHKKLMIRKDIDFEKMANEDRAAYMAEYVARFAKLREFYPEFKIPFFSDNDFSIDNLKVINAQYKVYVNRIAIDSTVDSYKSYLILAFLIIELVFTQFLGLNLSNYTTNQSDTMDKYNVLLEELGEKHNSQHGSSWPVEIRLCLLILFNVVICLVVNYCSSWFGPGAAKVIKQVIPQMLTKKKPNIEDLMNEPVKTDAPGGTEKAPEAPGFFDNIMKMMTSTPNPDAPPVRTYPKPAYAE